MTTSATTSSSTQCSARRLQFTSRRMSTTRTTLPSSSWLVLLCPLAFAFPHASRLPCAHIHIQKHGGTVSPGYSGVPYILGTRHVGPCTTLILTRCDPVDPHKPSGQNLWRQYAGKKGKLVLDARWVHECIKEGQLHTVHSNWAGCKVTGNET